MLSEFGISITNLLIGAGMSEAPGQPGAPGQGSTVVNGPVIHAHGSPASIDVLEDTQSQGIRLSVGGSEGIKLVLEHPPLNFIAAEIDLDITPVAALQPNQPVSSDQVRIELSDVLFDHVAFTPAHAVGDQSAPVVGSVTLLQGNSPVYTLTNVHAGHYGAAGGGQFSVGTDAQTGLDYVAYGPAKPE